jgi:hypothetical protein
VVVEDIVVVPSVVPAPRGLGRAILFPNCVTTAPDTISSVGDTVIVVVDVVDVMSPPGSTRSTMFGR